MLVSTPTCVNKFDDLFLPLSNTQHNSHEFIIVWSSLACKQHDEEPDKNTPESLMRMGRQFPQFHDPCLKF